MRIVPKLQFVEHVQQRRHHICHLSSESKAISHYPNHTPHPLHPRHYCTRCLHSTLNFQRLGLSPSLKTIIAMEQENAWRSELSIQCRKIDNTRNKELYHRLWCFLHRISIIIDLKLFSCGYGLGLTDRSAEALHASLANLL